MQNDRHFRVRCGLVECFWIVAVVGLTSACAHRAYTPKLGDTPSGLVESSPSSSAPDSTTKTRTATCRFGDVDRDAAIVTIAQLADFPEKYVGARVRTIGHYRATVETQAIVDTQRRKEVHVSLGDRDPSGCPWKKVTAQGTFRRAGPTSKLEYVLDVEGMSEDTRDKELQVVEDTKDTVPN
jgi:hypothetical protein